MPLLDQATRPADDAAAAAGPIPELLLGPSGDLLVLAGPLEIGLLDLGEPGAGDLDAVDLEPGDGDVARGIALA